MDAWDIFIDQYCGETISPSTITSIAAAGKMDLIFPHLKMWWRKSHYGKLSEGLYCTYNKLRTNDQSLSQIISCHALSRLAIGKQ